MQSSPSLHPQESRFFLDPGSGGWSGEDHCRAVGLELLTPLSTPTRPARLPPSSPGLGQAGLHRRHLKHFLIMFYDTKNHRRGSAVAQLLLAGKNHTNTVPSPSESPLPATVTVEAGEEMGPGTFLRSTERVARSGEGVGPCSLRPRNTQSRDPAGPAHLGTGQAWVSMKQVGAPWGLAVPGGPPCAWQQHLTHLLGPPLGRPCWCQA